NGQELRERIAATSGLDLEIVDGDREAALTFAGATAGQSPAGTLLVGDLGGGSLELIISRDGVILSAVSLPLGSGRLTERRPRAACAATRRTGGCSPPRRPMRAP